MKSIRIIFLSMVILPAAFSNAQTINWSTIRQQKHIATINIAAEHALTFGAGYGYNIRSKRPVVLNAEFSFPSGKDLTDDFKVKTGAQVRWWQWGNFHVASKIQGIFRRNHNEYARLLNFGADLSATTGYYKRHWFIAGELGFDKAIVTHFKHSDLYKSNFPGVQDGWYEPSTGGNIYYGLLGGWSARKTDVSLKIGKLIQQDFHTSPMLPIYAQLGFSLRFGK